MTGVRESRDIVASEWTDDRVALLRKLWGDGDSCSQIATQLGGITRNAVIGKVHRLGLSGRAKAPPRYPRPRSAAELEAYAIREQQRQREKRAKARIRALAMMMNPQIEPDAGPIAEAPPPPEFLGLDLMDMDRDQCRFPRGDNPPFKFCGQPTTRGSYCDHCYRIVYTPFKPARRRAFVPARGEAA